MELLSEVTAWFADPASWAGRGAIPTRLLEHLVLSGLGMAIGMALALPLGLYIGHTGRFALGTIWAANVGRALPSLAIIAILVPFSIRGGFGIGFWPTVLALAALAVPPMVVNTHAGLREVDREAVDAGRGLGMRPLQLLTRVEIPMALPVILGGVRVAAVQVVATATLGAVFATGGLGRYIIDGIARNDHGQLVGGAIVVAALSILTEVGFGLLQRRAAPPEVGESQLEPSPVGAR